MSQKPKTSNPDAVEIGSLWPGRSIELLKELHILTRDGRLNQDSRRKLKQVRHLVQLIEPALEHMSGVADLGAGKSYLGFMLYDAVLAGRPETRLWAVEQREQLIESCRAIASVSGFDRIDFIRSSIQDASNATGLPAQIDVVTALHACDTATDEAIAFALKKDAKVIALVPCCQAEVARMLESERPTGLGQLWRHGIHRREFGSHVTNVVRALHLESRGFKVRVTELVGWEHSMKNELILGQRVQRGNAQAAGELDRLLDELPFLRKMRLFNE